MKLWTAFIALCFQLTLMSGCGAHSSADWAFSCVVYEGDLYKVTDEKVIAVGREIAVYVRADDQGKYGSK